MSTNLTEAIVELQVNDSDHDELIICRLSHPAFSESLEVNHRLNVIFSPRTISATSTPQFVQAGDSVTLTCESSPSNPVAKVTWHTEGKIQGFEVALAAKDTQKVDGRRVQFTMKTTSADDGKVFSCKADNGIHKPITTNITLSVLHPPVWIQVPPRRVRVLEWQNISVEAKASANPRPLRYEWIKGANILSKTSAKFQFWNLSRNDTGTYTVRATNPSGTLNASFYLDVQYPAELTLEPRYLILKENGSGKVVCNVEGNPTPKVSWISLYGDHNPSRKTSKTLFLENVSLEDSRIVICEAENGIGDVVRAYAKIIVEHGATLFKYSGLIVTLQEKSAFLLCHGRGFPKPHFEWTISSGAKLIGTERESLAVHDAKIIDDITLWVSILHVADYEAYMNEVFKCAVRNPLGEDFRQIRISAYEQFYGKGRLKIVNASGTSVSLAWDIEEQRRISFNIFLLVYFNLLDPASKVMRPLNESVVTLENLIQEGLYIATLYAGGERAFITELLDTLVFTLKTESPLSNINSLKSNLAFGDMKVPSLVLLISSLSGTSLLVVNVALITCYLRSKRSRKGIPSHTVKETSRSILQPDNLPPDIYTPVKKSKFDTETSSSETDGVYHYKRKYSSTDSIYDNTSLTLPRDDVAPQQKKIIIAVTSDKVQTTSNFEPKMNYMHKNPCQQPVKKNVCTEKRDVSQNHVGTECSKQLPPSFTYSYGGIDSEASYKCSKSAYPNLQVLKPIPENTINQQQQPPQRTYDSKTQLETYYPFVPHLSPLNNQEYNTETNSVYRTNPSHNDSIQHQSYVTACNNSITRVRHHNDNISYEMSLLKNHAVQPPDNKPHYDCKNSLDLQPKYSTLDVGTLRNVGSANYGDHKEPRYCSECPCKMSYQNQRGIESYATLGPHFRRNPAQFTQSLPRFKSIYNGQYYDNNYCKNCYFPDNNYLRSANSSYELCYNDNVNYRPNPYRNNYSYSNYPYTKYNKQANSSYELYSLDESADETLKSNLQECRPKSSEALNTDGFRPSFQRSLSLPHGNMYTEEFSSTGLMTDLSSKSSSDFHHQSTNSLLRSKPKKTSQPRVTFYISNTRESLSQNDDDEEDDEDGDENEDGNTYREVRSNTASAFPHIQSHNRMSWTLNNRLSQNSKTDEVEESSESSSESEESRQNKRKLVCSNDSLEYIRKENKVKRSIYLSE